MVSMKKLSILTVAVFGIISLISLKSFAQKIGVVDGTEVLNNFSEAKNADEKIKSTGKMWQDSIQMMTKALQDKVDNYKKSYATMTKDAQDKASADVNK